MRLADGWLRWSILPALGALVAFWFWWPAAVALGIVAVGVLWFFRDPQRDIGEGIVAAADGRVQDIAPDAVTFLNLHDVHVVRAPYQGRVTRVETMEGPRFPAFLDRSAKNGGRAVTLNTPWGPQRVALIAGFLARRAVTFVEEGDHVSKGQRIGMIRFGSRVDVEIPGQATPVVEPGERVRAGESTLAKPPHGAEEGS